MAVLTDFFTVDPAARWAELTGVPAAPLVWDDPNDEVVVDLVTTSPIAYRYSAASPGSIEHEAQITFKMGTSSSETGTGGPGVRMDSGGAEDYYGLNVNWRTSEIQIIRSVGGTATDVGAIIPITAADDDWVTIRLAASGAIGANVVLDLWLAVDAGGGAKPNYVAMIGVDGSPDATRTDSDVDRLDAANHSNVGIVSGAQGNQYDTRHDNWRAQNISDRSGGGLTPSPGLGSVPMSGRVPDVLVAMSNDARIVIRKA